MLILGFVLELFLSLLFEVIVEFVMVVGWVILSSPFRKEREIPAGFAGLGIVLIAAFCAWAFGLFAPEAILKSAPVPGSSLLLSPVALGGLTHLGGKWMNDKGKPSLHIMTFWGGALFAFVLAVTRFILMR